MYSIIQDTLAALDRVEGTEVELRIPIPPHLFQLIKTQYGAGQREMYDETTLQYTDASDVRCVNGVWQRKRLVTRVSLPAARHMSLCVSVESPACEPAMPYQWHTVKRLRWTYVHGTWHVMFTSSERNHNVEIEYAGALRDLQQSARQQDNLCDLAQPLDRVVGCLAFTLYGNPKCWVADALPFVGLRRYACQLSRQKCNEVCTQMQKSQPVSMTKALAIPERPLVSAKCDGIRMVLCLSPQWQYGICRKGKAWFVPFVRNSATMVLDCEFVPEQNEFVVFDVYEINGNVVHGDYSRRLTVLSEMVLPQPVSHGLRVKVVYPPCVLSESWFQDQKHADGIIVHDGTSVLGTHNKLYKWKPVHTVDLYVGNDNVLMDGSYTPFMCTCIGHGRTLRKGEVWECAFEPDGKSVRPLTRRQDKHRANARHVCRDIRAAHREQLSIDDVRVLLQQIPARRPSKRAKSQLTS